jgi:hypothetical protein
MLEDIYLSASIAVTKYLRKQLKRRKYLFWLTASEVSLQGQMVSLLWVWDEA